MSICCILQAQIHNIGQKLEVIFSCLWNPERFPRPSEYHFIGIFQFWAKKQKYCFSNHNCYSEPNSGCGQTSLDTPGLSRPSSSKGSLALRVWGRSLISTVSLNCGMELLYIRGMSVLWIRCVSIFCWTSAFVDTLLRSCNWYCVFLFL